MARIPPFVLGHVGGALLVGLAGGAFLDWVAVVTFGAVLAGSAIVSTLACRGWPGFEGAGWKLWLAGCLANPLLLAGAAWSMIQRECLMEDTGGWDCMFSEVGPLAVAACLPSPLIGLAFRSIRRRSLGPAGSG